MPRWSLSSSTSEFKRWSDSACGVVVDGDVGVRPAERWCDRCRLASRVGVGIIGGSELAEPRPGSSMGDRANGDETSTPSGAVAVGGRVGVSEVVSPKERAAWWRLFGSLGGSLLTFSSGWKEVPHGPRTGGAVDDGAAAAVINTLRAKYLVRAVVAEQCSRRSGGGG